MSYKIQHALRHYEIKKIKQMFYICEENEAKKFSCFKLNRFNEKSQTIDQKLDLLWIDLYFEQK